MDAKQVWVNDFMQMSNTSFAIPIYQRNYAWKKTQCERLVQDILACSQKKLPHFIGSVVYIRDKDRLSDVSEFMIIDGQQRLTTLTLLYFALYHKAKELGDVTEAEKILELYLLNKFDKGDDKTKLKPVGDNREALRCVKRGQPEDYGPEKGISQLIENYVFFRNRITDKETYEQILKGLKQLEMVWIELDRKRDDPQSIFESLNSTGVPLEQHDLVRNYILMRSDTKEQEKLYEIWEMIAKHAKMDVLKTATQKASRVSEFIRDYLTIKTEKIPKEGDVYEEFKENYTTGMKYEQVNDLLNDMKKYAECYGKLLNPEREKNLNIRRHLSYINLLEIGVSYPFLMQVYRDYDDTKQIDAATFVEVLELFQSFYWRRAILSLRSSTKIFKDLYDPARIDKSNGKSYVESIAKLLLERKTAAEFPKDADIERTLKENPLYGRVAALRIKYMLERLQNYQNNEPIFNIDNPGITIEHIFPQNPEAGWEEDLGTQECKSIKEDYIHFLGNLTLTGFNSEMTNKRFRTKLEGDGQYGYKVSSFSRLNSDLVTAPRWGIEQIKARTERLAKLFLQVWKYPNVQMDQKPAYEEVDIFEADDPTRKKLEYAVFQGERLNVRNVIDLYLEVLKRLYNSNPESFTDTSLSEKSLAERIGVTTSFQESERGQYAELADDCYCYKWSSNQTKFDSIKDALETCGCKDALRIKYAEQ